MPVKKYFCVNYYKDESGHNKAALKTKLLGNAETFPGEKTTMDLSKTETLKNANLLNTASFLENLFKDFIKIPKQSFFSQDLDDYVCKYFLVFVFNFVHSCLKNNSSIRFGFFQKVTFL